jgi:hypothetical protein
MKLDKAIANQAILKNKKINEKKVMLNFYLLILLKDYYYRFKIPFF